MRQAAWAVNARKQKPQFEDQVTIVKRGEGGGRGRAPVMPLSDNQGATRNTGYGVDGQLQPMKRAGDVHEGERVLSANASQAVSDDVFGELSKQAESGAPDLENRLRSALGIAPMPGYNTGTLYQKVAPIQAEKPGTGTIMPIKAPPPPNLPAPVTMAARPETKAAPKEAPAIMPIKAPEPFNSTPTSVQPVSQAQTAAPPPTPIKNTSIPAAPTGSAGVYAQGRNAAFANTLATMRGENPVDRQIANKYTQDYDASAQTQSDVLNQQISSDSSLSKGQANSLMAQNAAQIGAQRSDLTGDLAIAASDRAQNAAVRAFDQGLQGQTYEEYTRPNNQLDLDNKARLAAYNAKKEANDLTFDDIAIEQTRRNSSIEKANALIAMGVGANREGIQKALEEAGFENADFSSLEDGETAGKFEDAMALLTKSIASGMDYGQAVEALKGAELYDSISGVFNNTANRPAWTGSGPDPISAGGGYDQNSINWLLDNGYTATGEPAGSVLQIKNKDGVVQGGGLQIKDKDGNPVTNQLQVQNTTVSKSGLQGLFNTLKSKTNTINQMVSTVTESDMYKNAPPEEKKKWDALNMALIRGDLLVDYIPDGKGGFTIKFKDGTEEDTTGATVADAAPVQPGSQAPSSRSRSSLLQSGVDANAEINDNLQSNEQVNTSRSRGGAEVQYGASDKIPIPGNSSVGVLPTNKSPSNPSSTVKSTNVNVTPIPIPSSVGKTPAEKASVTSGVNDLLKRAIKIL